MDIEIERMARRIRAWREGSGFTLQELAQRSGLAASTVQKIETLQMVPTVAVLLKLSRGLGRRPGELIHDGGDDVEVAHLRPADRHPIGVPAFMLVERLSGDLVNNQLEVWRVTHEPGTGTGDGFLRHGGEVWILVEDGTLTLTLGGKTHLVEAGDTFHFKASHDHAWKNDGGAPTRFVVAGTLPRELRAALRNRLAAVGERRVAPSE
jgi:transcriptional regulator with XRE-family HTH domain